MICQTIKSGIECGFMTKKGCGFNGGSCNMIIAQCEGCGKVVACVTGNYCRFILIRRENGGPGNVQRPPISRLK